MPEMRNDLRRIAENKVPEGCTHLTSPDLNNVQLRTHASYTDMVEALRAASVAGDAARFEKLEKAFGLRYTPGTLLSNESLSGMVRCPSKLYIDWQHAVVASGVVAQYEVNNGSDT